MKLTPQTPAANFALTKDNAFAFTAGMDGGEKVLMRTINLARENIQDGLVPNTPSAGDAIDYAIAIALEQAVRQGEDLAEVKSHLEYIHTQLGYFIHNFNRESGQA